MNFSFVKVDHRTEIPLKLIFLTSACTNHSQYHMQFLKLIASHNVLNVLPSTLFKDI